MKASKRIKGKEYVTASEFARRMNVTRVTVDRYRAEGKITGCKPEKKDKIWWFDWNEQKVLFLDAKSRNTSTPKAKETAVPKAVYKSDFHVIEPSMPDVREPSVSVPNVEDVMSGRSPLDSIRTAIDPNQEQDCWVIDLKTGEKVFSWEVCEKKYRAIILSMKARQQAGELIEKKEIAPALAAFGSILSSALNGSKFRMRPLIVAWAERLGAKIMPEDEIYLNEQIMDMENTRMADDLRHEIEKESEAFTADKENEDGKLDS